MSDILEKTFAALPSILTGTKQNTPSRAFQTFIQSLCAIRTKHDEESFVQKELRLERQRLSQPGVSTSLMREILVRLLYCHMLGYDVSFAHITAIKLAQQGALLEKRVGYLMCGMMLRDSSELIMLLVNTIQKDIRSSNILEVCSALSAAGRLLNAEMIPAVLPLVQEKTKHSRMCVRRRALLCLHDWHVKAPELLDHSAPMFSRALTDPHPTVMSAAIHFHIQRAQVCPESVTELCPTFLHILNQILNRQLSSDYDFHSVPAPWLQVHLLHLLGILGHKNEECSEQMYPVLRDVLQRTDPSHKIGLAVIYECLRTILHIHPHPALIQHAAKCIGKFVSSTNINLKYLGIKALSFVVKINPSYAVAFQDILMDCLEHQDISIQHRTLDLLCCMTNEQNIQVIVQRLIIYMSKMSDSYAQSNLAKKILNLCHSYSELDRIWYFDSVCTILETCTSATIPEGLVYEVISHLRKGEVSENCHQHITMVAWKKLYNVDALPPLILLQLYCKVVGTFFPMCRSLVVADIANCMHGLLSKASQNPSYTHKHSMQPTDLLITDYISQVQFAVLSTLRQLALYDDIPDDVLIALNKEIPTQHATLRQELCEIEGLCKLRKSKCDMKSLRQTTPCHQLDFTLSFLDEYVCDWLDGGNSPYQPPVMTDQQAHQQNDRNLSISGLHFGPYERMSSPSSSVLSPGRDGAASMVSADTADSNAGCGLRQSGVRQVWGKEGLLKDPTQTPESTDVPDTSLAVADDAQWEVKSQDDVLAEVEREQQQQKKKELAAALFAGIT